MFQKIAFPLFLNLLGYLITAATAQTAVYICSETGAYGYCYGSSDVQNCAYNQCIKYGGRSPKLVGSVVYGKGYGAIAKGRTANGQTAIGMAAGYSTQAEADRQAKYYCQNGGGLNPYIDAQFYDKPQSNSSGNECCCQFQFETPQFKTEDGTVRYCYRWTTPEECRKLPDGKIVYKPKDECRCAIPR